MPKGTRDTDLPNGPPILCQLFRTYHIRTGVLVVDHWSESAMKLDTVANESIWETLENLRFTIDSTTIATVVVNSYNTVNPCAIWTTTIALHKDV